MPQGNGTDSCYGCGSPKRSNSSSLFCSSRCHLVSVRGGIIHPTDSARFDVKIEQAGACHLFRGDLNHAGYGTFYVGRYSIRAHVFAWIRKHGPVPEGLEVCHSCHVRACTADDHLYLDTHDGNMKLSAQDGRMASGERNAMRARPAIRAVGERSGMAKLTAEQVLEIRATYRPRTRGYGSVALARRYNVTHQSIESILKRETWRHI